MPDRPNILFIMTDQQRGDALSIDGHPALLTPNMDHLAQSGARFRHAYSTCPSCVPARRSLMSGQHPPTTGMVGYRDHVEWTNHPPLLPEVLRDAGYQTALVGRSMHMAPARKRYGFEQMIQSGHYGYSDYKQWLRSRTHDEFDDTYSSGVMHNDRTARPWHLDEALHQTNWTVNESLRWLQRRDPTAPFFLVVSFIAPHPPLVPPACYFDRYMRMDLPQPAIGDWATPPENGGIGTDVAAKTVHLQGETLRAARAGYYGLINHVDDQMRRLLNGVTGIDKMTDGNTIIVFTSDHGEMLGDHHRWAKSQPYESSARVPLFIRGQRGSGLSSGVVRDEPVCLEDIMPTLLDMVDVPIPASVEGRSLLPLMKNEQPAWRDAVHIEHAGQAHALTDGQEKYIWWPQDGSEQFFDLAADAAECRDLMRDDAEAHRADPWRRKLIERLGDRPEGFVDDGQLVAGRPYGASLPHAGRPLTEIERM